MGIGGCHFEGLYTHYKDGHHHSSTLEGGMETGYSTITVRSRNTDGLHAVNFVNLTTIYVKRDV